MFGYPRLHRAPSARIAAAALALVFAGTATAKAADDAALAILTRADATDRLAFDLVTSLTTEVGPRPAGTEADTRARIWALAKFRELGISKVREEPFELTAWIRGNESLQLVAPAQQTLVMAGLGRSVGTPASGIEAPVMRFADFDALKAAQEGSLTGKIAFIDGRIMKRSRLGEDAGEGYGRRVKGASEASRKGAVAVLVRSVGSSEHRFAHTGGLRYEKEVSPIPGAALAHADADQLARIIAKGGDVRVRLKMEARLVPGAKSANIVADIPGTDLSDEIVLLGAHLDSWDQGTGAIDDGAGVAIVMAAAKRILDLGVKPRRTIRIVLFGSEELGLEGAAAYQQAHKTAKHVIATEADFGGAMPWGFYTGVPDAMLPEMDRVAERLAPLGISRGHNRASGGEDLGPLKRAGVAVASIVQDGTHYFDYHHTADDVLDKIDPAALQRNVDAFALFAWTMANPGQTQDGSGPKK